MKLDLWQSFNPLNQVYVFNTPGKHTKNTPLKNPSFNPLNQVYVFNNRLTMMISCGTLLILIP